MQVQGAHGQILIEAGRPAAYCSTYQCDDSTAIRELPIKDTDNENRIFDGAVSCRNEGPCFHHESRNQKLGPRGWLSLTAATAVSQSHKVVVSILAGMFGMKLKCSQGMLPRRFLEPFRNRTSRGRSGNSFTDSCQILSGP